jgi:electron transport complex protein RnfE
VTAAAADAVGQAIGFGLALTSIAAIREILGTGMLAGFQVLPSAWPQWVIMVLPPGAFLTFGLLLALVNWIDSIRSKKGELEG